MGKKAKNKDKQDTSSSGSTSSSGLLDPYCLPKDDKVHINISQEVIITTEDKIRLSIHKYVHARSIRSDWVSPLLLLVTFLLVFTTTDFHNNFLFSGDVWKGIFIVLMFSSIAWMIFAVVYSFRHITTIDLFIREIKKIR